MMEMIMMWTAFNFVFMCGGVACYFLTLRMYSRLYQKDKNHDR